MKPILFNTEMVRAILAGRKTATRRVVKPVAMGMTYEDGSPARKPPYCPSDILYVRETWRLFEGAFGEREYCYLADERTKGPYLWRPSIHMPKEAARLFLRVTDVRVERLQDITPEQIDAEGCKEWAYSANTGELLPSGPIWFRILWDKTIKSADRAIYGWATNPWVWVIEFERITKEEAEDGAAQV